MANTQFLDTVLEDLITIQATIFHNQDVKVRLPQKIVRQLDLINDLIEKIQREMSKE